MGFLDFANHPVVNQLHGRSVLLGGVNLDSHLGDKPIGLGILGQHPGLGHVMSQWFLSVEMKSHLHGRHPHGGMHVIGGGYVYAIEILAFPIQHFSPIGIHFNVLEALFALSSSHRVDLGNRLDSNLGMGFDLSEIRARHPSASETRMTEDLIWTGLGPRSFGQVGESETCS